MPTFTYRRLLPACLAAAVVLWSAAFGCCLFVEGSTGARVHSALLALAVTASLTVCIMLAMRTILRVLTAHVDAQIANMGVAVDKHCRDLNASMRHLVWADREDQRRRSVEAVSCVERRS